eukprot:g420.t1
MALRSVFYAEFDNDIGPRIVHEYPLNSFRREEFVRVSNYVITEPSLSGRALCVRAFDKIVVAFPVRISDARYVRNALLFSLGFVADRTLKSDKVDALKKILIKLGAFVKRMELERRALSESPDAKAWIARSLQNLFSKLADGSVDSCSIEYEGDVLGITLRSFHMNDDGQRRHVVKDHDVPVLLDRNYLAMKRTTGGRIDLTIERILPLIDGIRYVRAISDEADADIEFVRKALQSMHHHGILSFIDIFQYSNIYIATDRMQQLATSSKLRDECVRACCCLAAEAPVVGKFKTTFKRIFRAYCAFGCGTRVGDLLQRRPNLSKGTFDARRFIAFAVVRGFLRRIHEYPIVSKKASVAVKEETRAMIALFDGKHSIDAICASLSVPRSVVVVEAKSLGNACVIMRR